MFQLILFFFIIIYFWFLDVGWCKSLRSQLVYFFCYEGALASISILFLIKVVPLGVSLFDLYSASVSEPYTSIIYILVDLILAFLFFCFSHIKIRNSFFSY